LVKVAYSTCDPYDGICSELFKSDGYRLGGEGCGTIISVGEGVDKALLNKKISFHAGAWAQYKSIEVASSYFMILDDSQDLSKAAASYINPLTTIGQVEFLEKKKAKWFVADAAASQLNKMLIKLCRSHPSQFEPICIVRKEDHAKILREQHGIAHVLLQDSATFVQDYKVIAAETKPLVFFDCVGGGSPAVVPVIESLGHRGVTVIVACLTGKPIPINTIDFLFNDKSLQPYLIFQWIADVTPERRQEVFKQVADDLAQGGKLFATNFTQELTLENWKQALTTYHEVASRDGGKILLRCNP
jgi:hypothetical protein